MSYVVFGGYSFIYFGISHGDADRAVKGLAQYFACESTGHVPGKCDRRSFELHLYPRMSVIAYVFIGMVPISIIIFIVNWHKLWKSITNFVKALRPSRAESPLTIDSSLSVSSTNKTNGL